MTKSSENFHEEELRNLYVFFKDYSYADEDKESWRVGM